MGDLRAPESGRGLRAAPDPCQCGRAWTPDLGIGPGTPWASPRRRIKRFCAPLPGGAPMGSIVYRRIVDLSQEISPDLSGISLLPEARVHSMDDPGASRIPLGGVVHGQPLGDACGCAPALPSRGKGIARTPGNEVCRPLPPTRFAPAAGEIENRSRGAQKGPSRRPPRARKRCNSLDWLGGETGTAGVPV